MPTTVLPAPPNFQTLQRACNAFPGHCHYIQHLEKWEKNPKSTYNFKADLFFKYE